MCRVSLKLIMGKTIGNEIWRLIKEKPAEEEIEMMQWLEKRQNGWYQEKGEEKRVFSSTGKKFS